VLFLSCMTIQQWLKSDRDYATGLQLLQQNGGRASLLQILAKETTYNRNRLVRELHKVAERGPDSPPAKPQAKPARTPSAVKPNLQTGNWPEELHPAVQRLQQLYQLVNHYHPQMDQLYNINRKQAFEVKCAVQDSWEEINEIWRILNYYRDHKVMLPNRYNPNEKHLPYDRARLMKRRNTLRTYLSRDKNNPAKADKVMEWQKELDLVQKKLQDVV